jgi:hypothetical protein
LTWKPENLSLWKLLIRIEIGNTDVLIVLVWLRSGPQVKVTFTQPKCPAPTMIPTAVPLVMKMMGDLFSLKILTLMRSAVISWKLRRDPKVHVVQDILPRLTEGSK